MQGVSVVFLPTASDRQDARTGQIVRLHPDPTRRNARLEVCLHIMDMAPHDVDAVLAWVRARVS